MTIQYIKQAKLIPKEVFFTGSTQLYQGMGLCYDRDNGTAADDEGYRDKAVELPDTSNNRNFAGVVAQDYAGISGGRRITIYEPGSVCLVAIGADTVINTGRLTCSCSVGDAGRFAQEGLPGRGSMVPLQTVSSGVVIEQRDGGTDAFDSTGLILATPSTTGLSVGDWVFILAGEDDNTNAITPTVGPHEITAIVTDTSIAIATVQSDGGTMEPSFYTMVGNQMCLAYLEEGPESGLSEWVTPANGAVTCMVGGITHLHGGFTPSADSTFTVADGDVPGLFKAFRLMGVLGSNDFLATVTNGLKLDGTALSTVELDADQDGWFLHWGIKNWRNIETDGTEA